MMSRGQTHPRILVIGESGQLGRALRQRAGAGLSMMFAGRGALDLADPATIPAVVAAARPDLVINAAACTDIDAAEVDEDLAIAINAMAPEVLARTANQCGAAFLHISTAEVFDGAASRPYRETDHAAPLNIHGATKLLGEELVQLAHPRTAILRTATIYSPTGRNLVRSAVSRARSRAGIEVAADRTSSPTSADELARACLEIASQLIDADPYSDLWGVTHCAGQGSCSDAELVEAALSHAQGVRARVVRLTLADWPVAAARPKWTALDCARLTRLFGVQMRPWQAPLGAVVRDLQAPAASEAA